MMEQKNFLNASQHTGNNEQTSHCRIVINKLWIYVRSVTARMRISCTERQLRSWYLASSRRWLESRPAMITESCVITRPSSHNQLIFSYNWGKITPLKVAKVSLPRCKSRLKWGITRFSVLYSLVFSFILIDFLVLKTWSQFKT